MLRRGLAATALVGALAVTFSGCGVPGVVTSQSCIDWVYFETPADAAAEASAVALGSVTGQSGSTQYEGMAANIWTVEVVEWLKGGGGDSIDVVSLPRSCGDSSDSMAQFELDDSVVLFLRSTGNGWEGITPWQQVTAAEDGTFPEAWPDDLYD
ncbi:hypothetical protein [Microbacterium abyssi]|uniref:hypothetical protein n=1 Tax=Microbacterium abyssi TaxID=2782166 RepID=UPI0018895D29|nr:hypothetical protein [Microbacterium sp. A18JL241]